jgi:hypothetical protein
MNEDIWVGVRCASDVGVSSTSKNRLVRRLGLEDRLDEYKYIYVLQVVPNIRNKKLRSGVGHTVVNFGVCAKVLLSIERFSAPFIITSIRF